MIVMTNDQDDRDHRQNDGRDPALGTQRLDAAPNPIAVADGLVDGIEDLAEVTADLAVDLNGFGYPAEVLAVHPIGGRLQVSRRDRDRGGFRS